MVSSPRALARERRRIPPTKSEFEAVRKPTGDSDDSSGFGVGVPLRRTGGAVEELPPPPLEGQRGHNFEEVNLPVPLGLVTRRAEGSQCGGQRFSVLDANMLRSHHRFMTC